MAKQGSDSKASRAANDAMDNLDISDGIQASSSETAEYLAQMASELVMLAKSAHLERLTVLLDLVRREAESTALRSSAASNVAIFCE